MEYRPAHRMKVGMPIFANSYPKPVTIAWHFERSRKEDRIDISFHTCTHPENMVNIDPVPSEIIGLQGDR